MPPPRFDRAEPCAGNAWQAAQAALILDSHARLFGRALLAETGAAPGRALYEASGVVLAHDTAADPVFFFANRAAQRLFGMSWAEMVRLPSRHSAEPLARAERQRLLERVARDGCIDDYRGVRVAKDGRRFRIERAAVWNLIDAAGRVVGQAAAFDAWTPLP